MRRSLSRAVHETRVAEPPLGTFGLRVSTVRDLLMLLGTAHQWAGVVHAVDLSYEVVLVAIGAYSDMSVRLRNDQWRCSLDSFSCRLA
jgi:hypothetical protein